MIDCRQLRCLDRIALLHLGVDLEIVGLQVTAFDLVHAHREEQSASIPLPEVEDRLEWIVPKCRNGSACQFPDGYAEVAAIGKPGSRGHRERSDAQGEVVLGRTDGR
jgi:hypothetical protein